MPAQWQKYSLRTQQEMWAGRKAIKADTLARWADEGVAWLCRNIPADDLEFASSWDMDKLEITLDVYRKKRSRSKLIFTVTEKAEAFVSHLTVTKILMIS